MKTASGITQDITERKRAEEARERLLRDIADERARLQDTLNALPVGVWIADATGKVTMVNDIARVIWGGRAPASERIEDYYEYKFWWSDTGERARAEDMPLARAVTHGETRKNIQIDIERFDGTRGTTLISGAPIRDVRGDIIGGIVIVQDISDLKRTEEELKVEKARAELYLDLMGHDINNMNQAAQGFLELALQTLDADGKIGRDGRVLVEKPLQAVQGSSRLISNVRKLQRLADEGVKTRPVDLHDLFEELKSQDFHTGDRDATININEVPHWLAEGSDLLRDVFFNLVSNAVKHAEPDRPVTVDVGAERVVHDGRAYYRCTVEDDGPGVPDGLKTKLFHRFQRGKTQAHGKGLGLYLVRTLVEGYGGRVWVEDRVHGDHTKGARFVIMLPLAK